MMVTAITEKGKIMGKNFAQRMNGAIDQALDIGFRAGYQKAADLFLVAVAVEFGFGEDRVARLSDRVNKLDQIYGNAWRIDDESDWSQSQIDGILKCVCGDKFVPFYERNYAVKKISYGKKKGK